MGCFIEKIYVKALDNIGFILYNKYRINPILFKWRNINAGI